MVRWLLFGLLFFAQVHAAFAYEFLLDPGHSPSKPGAESCSGGLEYVYNDNLVRTIVNDLHNQGIDVDVTKNPGADLSLQARAQKAKGKKIFLSIHHDSAQPYLITRKHGHPCSDKVSGYSIFVSRKNKYFELSLEYARALGRELQKFGMVPSTHHGEPVKGENRPLLDAQLGIYQYDDLIVLKHADAPALLLEAAVIVNPQDDAMAKSVDFQHKIASAIKVMLHFALVHPTTQ
ncbi:MAG: N-acetylmuramoyl-L-alanine amidase [Desulfovibrio sp.]|nr:N-acetylmuramoyl-L-alanine amidase [Desulfovibrio sp.]